MSFETALQTAIKARLTGFPGIPDVHDFVPSKPTYPYVVVGEDKHVSWDTDDSSGTEATITMHTWSQYRGKNEVKDIHAAIYSALHRYDLTVSGQHVVTLEFDFSEVMPDPDPLTIHGISRFRALVETV